MPIAGALAASIAVGYALGSIPWAYVFARLKGVDITTVDTGIAGAANVYRRLGWALGVGVFIGDAGKGAAAVALALALGADGALALPALGAAIVGHWWPLLGRFPGGVGLATLVGGTVAAAGLVALPALAFGLAMVGVLRNTGNGAGFGFAMYVALGLSLGADREVVLGVIVLALVVITRARLRQRAS